LCKENQDLKIINASLTTENELLRKQVTYFQGIVQNQPFMQPQQEIRKEEILCPDEPFKELEEPILHVDSSDYEFFGPSTGHESPASPSAIILTIVFAILFIVSSFGMGGNQNAGGTNVIPNPGYGVKTTGISAKQGNFFTNLFEWFIDPYVLVTLYMLGMIIILLWHEKSWTRAKFRKIMNKIRSHSKTS